MGIANKTGASSSPAREQFRSASVPRTSGSAAGSQHHVGCCPLALRTALKATVYSALLARRRAKIPAALPCTARALVCLKRRCTLQRRLLCNLNLSVHTPASSLS